MLSFFCIKSIFFFQIISQSDIEQHSEVENTPPKPITQEEMNKCLQQKIDDQYNMNHSKRSTCLIFNHKHCIGWPKRSGTDVDRNRLKKTFELLNFKVVTHNDRTKSEILKEILPAGESYWSRIFFSFSPSKCFGF